MSVTSETYKVFYPGRGDTGPYPITFDVVLNDGGNATDIVVKLLDADGVETDITSVCTVTGMNVYTTASYSADYDVVLIRYPSLTQPYTFPYVTKFPSRTFESALDRLLFLVQRLALGTDQSFKVPLSEPEPAREPSIVDRANKWRAFDNNGDPIAVDGAAGEYPVSDFMATVINAADAAAALALLGIVGMSNFIKTLMDDADAATARATLELGVLAIGDDLDDVPNGTYQKVHGDYVDADGKIDSIKEVNGTRLVPKVIEIGDWDMDAAMGYDVDHGVANYKKIRSLFVIVRDDTDFEYLNLCQMKEADGLQSGGITKVDATQIHLWRRDGGAFDSVSWDEPPDGNRGWITIWYEV